MPMPMPGEAMISGHVLDPDGVGVAATITVAETDVTATSDGSGAFVVTVPSDSTVTLVASSDGHASTYRDSVVLASQSAVDGFDFLMLPTDRYAAMNAMATVNAMTGGLVAVRLHSLSAGCATDGAQLAVWPPKAGTIVYSSPGAAGSFDQPDATITAVQAGTTTSAWIAGAISPGNMLAISVQQAGCMLVDASPSMNGMVFPGLRHPATGMLTQTDLFLQSVQ
jgi:hypothetical protein